MVGMNREVIESLLDAVRRLPVDERLAVADEVDRIAWRDRVQAVLDRVAHAPPGEDPPDDAEIDANVEQVRAEKSLYERYWTRRRRSAP